MKLKYLTRYFSSIGWCLSFSWTTSNLYTIARIGIQILLPLLTIAASFIGKYLINLLAGAGSVVDPAKMLVSLFAGLLLIALIKTVLQKLATYYRAMHSDLLRSNISLMMMDHSLSSDLEYFDNPDYHDKLLSATRDSSSIINIVWNTLSGISASVAFVVSFVVLSQSNVLYSLLMTAAAVPSAIVAAKYTKSIYTLSIEQTKSERKLNYYQSIAVDRRYAQDLRLFNVVERLKNRYRQLWNQIFTNRQNMTRARTLLTALLNCLPEIVVVMIGIDIAFNVLAKTTSVGDYSLYTGLVGQLWRAISQLSSSTIQIYDNQLKIENVRTLEQFQNHVIDKGTGCLKQVDTIEFDHVCFSYPGTDVQVLNDVTFKLKREEKVALVGLNGSGKSTLIKLLLRMYDPDSGIIRINGVNIREYSLATLRSNFSVYFQEMQNYCFTLKENLTIADNSQDQELKEALAKASLQSSCCEDILDRAPKGLDTSLTRYFEEDGIELSTGQHQKLALARTLYRRHTALILDEPSSSLDPKAEHEIIESLQSFTDGQMTIFTSHRLSNIFLADRIIVLEEGRVAEDGTQEELLKNKQRYAELFNYQKEKYMPKTEEKEIYPC